MVDAIYMAMLDALELSNHLLNEDYTAIRAAIEAFEKQMRLRAAKTVMVTMEATEALHSGGAIKFLIDVIS